MKSFLVLFAALALGSACAVEEPPSEGEATDDHAALLSAEGKGSSEGTLVNYIVSVMKTGSGGGWVLTSPGGISCSPSCSVADGTVLTLVATAASSSTFGGWNGAGCSGTGSCTFTVTGDVTLGANFQWNFYSLTASKTGGGSGTVTSSPAGINCGSSCSTQIRHGQFVSLTATPASGSIFVGWSGACSGNSWCDFTMTGAASVTANFAPANPIVSVMKTGSGGGGVFSSPSYISCSPACSVAIPYGTILTLTASPAASSSFGGWTGAGCSGTGTCTFTVTNDVTLGANFQWNFYPLTVSKTGPGFGTVTSSPSGINCGSACSTQIRHGQFVTLTAAPAVGSTFVGWSGACTGTGACGFTMTATASVTANFQ
jgi:hypothetical protein